MPEKDLEYLKHIFDECKYIESVNESGITKEDFLENSTLKRAIVRSLEIIGEASKKIEAEAKNKWDSIKWKEMAGMRDRLIHDYMGVNYNIVWDVMINKIPELQNQLNDILGE